MSILIKNAKIINEKENFHGDVYIKSGRIEQVGGIIDRKTVKEINAEGLILMPGIIDDQVHFREPGMAYKATVYSESRAALAGGITSFMDMPNTKPASLTQELLHQRYLYAGKNAAANYSFYMGVSNDNLEEVLKTNPKDVCGVKIFMGSSTGNMLVDNESVLEAIFSKSPMLIATHCEDEKTIKDNEKLFLEKYGEALSAIHHPQIRSSEACFLSSSFAVQLAKKFGTRLHVLHLTSEREMELFDGSIPLNQKRITAEVCVHHLFFNESSYEKLGNGLKCNPAVKSKNDQQALLQALLDNKLDVVATDHAPHTPEEKQRPYVSAPSGLPLVQHSLQGMIELYKDNKISLENIVHKMCHAPAIAFKIRERGFIREGYAADITLLDLNKKIKVAKKNILYKCAWSPFEGMEFGSAVDTTIVNGAIAYRQGEFFNTANAERLLFDR